jgi:hypothetical protein
MAEFGWQAGEKAVTCGVSESGNIEELGLIRDLHIT